MILQSDDNEVERRLKMAVEHRVKEILDSARSAVLEEHKHTMTSHGGFWSRAIQATTSVLSRRQLRPRLATSKLTIWMWAKAVSLLVLPGALLYLILLPQWNLSQVVITTRIALSLFGLGG
jgi:hypothetical protein